MWGRSVRSAEVGRVEVGLRWWGLAGGVENGGVTNGRLEILEMRG